MLSLKENPNSMKTEDFFDFEVSRESYQNYFDDIYGKTCQIFSDIIDGLIESNGIIHKIPESDDYFQLITENANDLIAVHNNKFEYEYINEPVFKKILGYTKEDLIGKTNLNLIHPEDLKKTVLATSRILRKGEGIHELRFKHKNGTYKWLEATARNFFTKRNEKKVITILRDITERKQVEQKLKESEENNRLITENINDLIAIINPEFKCEYINGEILQKLLGYKSGDIIGKYILNFVHPEDIEASIEALRKGVKIGEGMYTLRYKHKDGHWVWLEIKGKTFRNENGELKGLLITRDINARKIIEEKLIQAERKYRHLYENSPFSLILIDQEGNILDCNPAVEKLINYKKEELINKNFRDLSIIHQKYLPLLETRFKKTINGEILPLVDIQIYTKDGNLIWINYITSLITIGNKKLMQIVLYDISERRNAANIILKEFKKLKELDQLRKDLINRVSHELKTPLVSVCGAIEILLSNYKNQFGKEELELLQTIERGGNRLKYLVNNLIDISRVKHKKLKLKKKPYDLTEIIKDCVKYFNFLLNKRKIVLNLKLPETLYTNIDKIRIEQVISNLLSNAIKNTPPNGAIQIALQEIEGWAKIYVYDTGIGLTEDEMEKIFTKFGKLERYGQGFDYLDIEGAGLGLFISKEIINLHGGQIWAESSGRNNGSTFIVKIPIE